ncbi:MAG TPA: ribonuclease J [Deltaproteobacteria bacterium]|nr:ribonuclease J [Deltaproteobacteria bacterium]
MSFVRIIPLGGVREFGLNSTVIETSRGSIVIDAGLMFPRYTLTGIDQIVPDFRYVIDNQEAFQGIVLTHGHEDHIGALPYLLRDAPIPVYGHPFTLELVKRKLREFDLDGRIDLMELDEGRGVTLAGMRIDPVPVVHSTVGCISLVLSTSQGLIVHSGDFRFAPKGFADLGQVRLFMCESTNAEKDPNGRDEDRILGNIEDIVQNTPGAVVVSTFSSHVGRIQSLYDIATRHDRRVAIIGRSMQEVVEIADDKGFMNLDPARIIDAELVNATDRAKLMIICTGAQGEIYSALSLISRGWHKFKVREGDSVIVSARVIPGNEYAIGRCVDQLLEFGAKVYYTENSEVHATGHATHEEIVKALDQLRPAIVMPIHGELRHMKALADLAALRGASEVLLSKPGQVWTLEHDGVRLSGEVPHGKCFVDGELTGDLKDVVLRDRRHISEGGLIVAFAVIESATGAVAIGPDVMGKGVVPAPMEPEIMDELRHKAAEVLHAGLRGDLDIPGVQGLLKEELGRSLKARLGKKPMIIPIIMEI